MATVIDMATWRARRGGAGVDGVRTKPDPLRRLELAVYRLDPAVTHAAARDGGLDHGLETELLAITGAISMGLTQDAVERAERLADRLEHPTARRRLT
jgi:hypothetical protein